MEASMMKLAAVFAMIAFLTAPIMAHATSPNVDPLWIDHQLPLYDTLPTPFQIAKEIQSGDTFKAGNGMAALNYSPERLSEPCLFLLVMLQRLQGEEEKFQPEANYSARVFNYAVTVDSGDVLDDELYFYPPGTNLGIPEKVTP
jgi:hypothetical protein